LLQQRLRQWQRQRIRLRLWAAKETRHQPRWEEKKEKSL
jgi:hypothetical protein